MSAVAMGMPATTVRRRPALYLVPTVVPSSPVGPSIPEVPARPAVVTSPVAMPADGADRRPALRLTQRGRLVRTLVLFAAASLLVSLAIARVVTPSPLVADRATTVRPGQTLSEIARAELPDLRVADGVARLRQLNGLAGTTIVAGQSLLIPAS